MKTFLIEAKFVDRGYIADPFWVARADLIDVQKQSGVNRARSEANRRKALEEYLRSKKMTLQDYENLEKAANEPFYRDNDGLIVIPEKQVSSFVVCICHRARAAMRPCGPDDVRSLFDFTDWATGKSKEDGIWERFVVVQAGTGQKLSNQRGLRKSAFITDFTATGRIQISEQHVKPGVVEQALRWGGEFVGVGASRKMGWGRFELVKFEEVSLSSAKAA